MLKLNGVTLFMLENVNPTDGVKVYNHVSKLIEFDDYIFASNKPRPKGLTDKVKYIPLQFEGLKSYNEFILFELYKHVQTTHTLTIHIDGFPINLNKWKDEFLNYDYVGAIWPKDWFPFRNGNGVGLRSKRAYDEIAKLKDTYTDKAEDVFVSVDNRLLLESKGIKFAPDSLAAEFSLEAPCWDFPRSYDDVFMFHGRPDKGGYPTGHLINGVLNGALGN